MDASQWITILVSILGSGTFSYLLLRRLRQKDELELRQFQHLLDTSLEGVRAHADRERQRAEFELRRLEEKIRTRYSWLYAERAQAMMAIYQSLLELQDAFDAFARSFGRLPGDTSGGPAEKWKAAGIVGESFRKLYQPKRLLFTKAVAEMLDEINRNHVAVWNTYHRVLVMEKGDEYNALAKMHTEDGFRELPDAYRAAVSLETEFRALFGSLDDIQAT